MPKIMSYKKLTDKYTTYTVVKPDYQEGDKRITELCTIDGTTYISVPDDVSLSDQPNKITLIDVVLTDELKEKIKKASPHMQLINQRVRNKIAEKYSVNDEITALRKKDNDKVKFDKYNAYADECCAWGDTEKDKLGV